MDKLKVFIEKSRKKSLDKILSKDFTMKDNIETIPRERVNTWQLFIRRKIFEFKDSRKVFFQDLKSFLRYGRKEMRFGGGGFDFELAFQLLVFGMIRIMIDGLIWDTAKLFVKKNYKYFKSKKIDYIEIVSMLGKPNDTRVIFLIPNNLEDNNLDYVLNEAWEIYKSTENIRWMFVHKKVIFKYKQYTGWQITTKN